MYRIGIYITGKLEQVLDMQMTTISDMQVGDLVIEIDLQVSMHSLVSAVFCLSVLYSIFVACY
jgi:hypothetical protein